MILIITMETRPRIQVTMSTTDKILDLAGWVILFVLWGLTIIFYDILPDTIPTKFSGSGEVVNTGSKATILFLPAIATCLAIALSALNNYPHLFNYPTRIHQGNALRQYSMATRMLRYIKFIIPLVFVIIILLIYRSIQGSVTGLHPWILILILALIFIPVGYFLVKGFKAK